MLKSLHHRLVASITLAWIALIAIILFTVYASDTEITEEANLQHLQYEATLVASQVEQSIKTRQNALTELAGYLESDAVTHHPESFRQALAANRMATAIFDRVAVISETGVVEANYPVQEGLLQADVSRRDYFKNAIASRRPTITDPFDSMLNGNPLVLLTHPLRDAEGSHAGILVGAFNLRSSQFFNRLEEIRIGERGYAALISEDGTILSHPDESLILENASNVVPNSHLEMALNDWEGHGTGLMPNGQVDLHAFAQVKGSGWLVRTSLPLTQAAAPIQHLQSRLWLLGIISILVVIPITWWLSRHILAPLHELEAQIVRIRNGQLEFAALTTNMDEMQQLANSFNTLERERALARNKLEQREAFLNEVLDNSPIGVFIANEEGFIIYRNRALERISGYQEGPNPLSRMADHVHPDDQRDFSDLWAHAVATQGDFLRQARYCKADGSILWIEAQASSVCLNGELLGYAGIVKDITQRREDDAVRLWEAEHDPLTGLLNRRGFERRLEEALAEHKASGEPAVLLFFDLDHFKPINDEGGHGLGDEMLVAVSRTMAKVCRRGDFLARPGGDEFAVLLTSCTLENAKSVADTLRLEMSQLRVMQRSRSYAVTLSLGLTPLLTTDETITDPLNRADQASYPAKADGRNRIMATTRPLSSPLS